MSDKRPTREQVDNALFGEREHREELADWDVDAAESFQVLAAEVRALRAELASVNTQVKGVFTKEFKTELLERTQECDRLRATIARVEACLAQEFYGESDTAYVFIWAVRAALRGDP